MALMTAGVALWAPGSASAAGSCLAPLSAGTQVVGQCTNSDGNHSIRATITASWVPVNNGAALQFECTADSDPDPTQTTITSCYLATSTGATPANAALVPFSLSGPAVAVQGQAVFTTPNLEACVNANATFVEGSLGRQTLSATGGSSPECFPFDTTTTIPSVGSKSLHATCALTGHANLAPPITWVGGNGAFGLTTSMGGHMACAGEHDGAPVVLTDVTDGLKLDAIGVYANLVCGTTDPLQGEGAVPFAGALRGTATISDNANPSYGVGSGGLGSAAFQLPLVAGQGVVVGNFRGAGAWSDVVNANLAGFVTILPNDAATQLVAGGSANDMAPPTNPAGTCIDNAAVAGLLVLSG